MDIMFPKKIFLNLLNETLRDFFQKVMIGIRIMSLENWEAK